MAADVIYNDLFRRFPNLKLILSRAGGMVSFLPMRLSEVTAALQKGAHACVVIVLKFATVALALKAGARGGLLTLSLAVGALLAVVMGSGWYFLLPVIPLASFAIVGAAAFLGSSMAMPLTVIALIIKFMHLPASYLPLLVLATMSATAARRMLQRSSLLLRVSV